MLEEYRARIAKIFADVDQVKAVFETARQAYEESCNTRRDHIGTKSRELEKEIRKEQDANALRPQRMADALSQGDIDGAVEIERQITETNRKVAELTHKKGLLSEVVVKGDPLLYTTALNAYHDTVDAKKKLVSIMSGVVSELDSVSEELNKLTEDAKYKFQSLSRKPIVPDVVIIKIVETHEGIIDVRGHTTMPDEMAKMRYINGSLAGIENTPAGQKLAAALKAAKKM